jgi:tRNA-specific 2-thiouridylase
MKPLIAIAISGGVDSLVAAHLLKEQGYNVIGIHFITGFEGYFPSQQSAFTASPVLVEHAALQRISPIADQVGIPVKVLDCRSVFKSRIIDYFISTYQAGKTPNPCLQCNPTIKFGTLLKFALRLGATGLATGHYARLQKDPAGAYHLLKGIDPVKDQSYFLAFLSQDQLQKAHFPLGAMVKKDVLKLAASQGLRPIEKNESQDVCFIQGQNYKNFLTQQKGFEWKPGKIVDVEGNTIGRHLGLHHFTIGQRRGINCPAAAPYYVVRIDSRHNQLIVGSKEDLNKTECSVSQINRINLPPATPIKIYTRVRYRHQAAPSTLFPKATSSALIKFTTPQSAITPGQGAVFYHNDEVLGGGWIDSLSE